MENTKWYNVLNQQLRSKKVYELCKDEAQFITEYRKAQKKSFDEIHKSLEKIKQIRWWWSRIPMFLASI